MNESSLTIFGNVATEPKHLETETGLHITSFRLASTSRRRDRHTNEWVDHETSYYSVSCFRGLARNVAASLRLGDPVVVTGTPRVRDWSNDERSGTSVDIAAATVGHDLRRGVGRFERVNRVRAVSPEEDVAARLAMEVMEEDLPDGVDPVTGELLDDEELAHELAHEVPGGAPAADERVPA
jgi:single-strand DNA-binding protein